MRVVFVGKGGAGKSAIAGTFARLLAQREEPVLAIDSDPMPGLAFSLGLKSVDTGIPDEAVEERAEGEEGPPYRLRAGLSPQDAIDLYAATGPDGVRFLQFGKLRGHQRALFRSQYAFRAMIDGLTDERWNLVGDLPGGPRQAAFGWGDYADTFLLVVDPSVKSMASARRIARVAMMREEQKRRVLVVANRVRVPGDAERIAQRTGLEVVASIPWDDEFARAEQQGRAPIDSAPGAAAVKAVKSLVDRMSQERVP